jgi:hypothetical protein
MVKMEAWLPRRTTIDAWCYVLSIAEPAPVSTVAPRCRAGPHGLVLSGSARAGCTVHRWTVRHHPMTTARGDTMDDGWLVVVSRVACEDMAEAAIERAGYVVFLPRYRARLVGVRLDAGGRRIRTRGAGAIVLRPLLPPYMFVRWHDGLRQRPLLVAAGVAQILRNAPDAAGVGRPKLVSAAIVEELRHRVDAGHFDTVGSAAPGKPLTRRDLQPGDQVRTTAHGVIGQLLELTDAGGAQLLAEWFGELRRVTVGDAGELELAAGD